MWEIGDAKCDVGERVLDFSQGSLGVFNTITQLFHCHHGLFGRFFGSSQSGNLLRALIEFVPELLDLRRHGSPFFTQFLEISPQDVVPTPSERGADMVEVFAEIL